LNYGSYSQSVYEVKNLEIFPSLKYGFYSFRVISQLEREHREAPLKQGIRKDHLQSLGDLVIGIIFLE
jgi:hypothetical protein